RLRITERHGEHQVVSVPNEQRMLGDVDLAVQVTPRAAEISRFALAAQAELHAVIDARGHFHLEAHDLLLAPRSGALRAFFADNLAGAAAGRASGLDAEKALGLHHLAAPGAVGAALGLRSRLGARAIAGRAQFGPLDFDCARAAKGRLAQ